MAETVEVLVKVARDDEPALKDGFEEYPRAYEDAFDGDADRLGAYLEARAEEERDWYEDDDYPGPEDDFWDEDPVFDDFFEERPSAFSLSNKELGARGEQAAMSYLRHRGFTILAHNWKCPFGEADIVALDNDTGAVCFIEVKTRRSLRAGLPEEAITRKKQSKYERIAMCFLADTPFADGTPVRFDAIGICVTGDDHALLRHHRGCFDGCR